MVQLQSFLMMPENLANLPNVWRERKVKDEDDRPMAAFKMACFQWSKTIKTEQTR
jgi:hypothetical protein